MLASKFDGKATKVEAWAVGKDTALENTEDINSSNLAEIMVNGREGEGEGEGREEKGGRRKR